MKSVVTGLNRFCGPAVLSILTGRSVDECASVLGSFSGQYEVREVRMADLIKASAKLRFKLESVPNSNGSLFYVLHSLADKPGMYLVNLPKHVVAVEVTDEHKIFFCDNHTREPINAGASARLGQKCLGVYKAEKMPEPELMRIEYDIDLSSGCRLKKHLIHTNPEDNIVQYLGAINASGIELINIATLIISRITKEAGE